MGEGRKWRAKDGRAFLRSPKRTIWCEVGDFVEDFIHNFGGSSTDFFEQSGFWESLELKEM